MRNHEQVLSLRESERLTEQVEARYNVLGRPVETFNAGMPGYGTGQAFRAMERLVPAIEPDVVVVRYCTNDIGDSALPYDFRLWTRVYKPFYDLEGRLILNDPVPVRFSHRVRDSWLGGLAVCYFVDWIDRNDATYDDHGLRVFRVDNGVHTELARKLDAVLYRAERALTSDKGLPRRPWYRHFIYAPGFYTGYGVKTLPGVREAIEQRDWKEAEAYVHITADRIDAFSLEVNRATGLLSKGQSEVGK